MARIQRILPPATAVSVGILVLAATIVENEYLSNLGTVLIHWAVIISASALLLGIINVVKTHGDKLRRRDDGWIYSGVLLSVFLVVLSFGIIRGAESPLVRWIFRNVTVPIQATIFSLLAFYMFTAVCRVAKVYDLESAIFWGVGIIVLIGQVPLSSRLWHQLPAMKEWVLAVPVTAGARGLMLGVVLGTVATGARLLLGIDRPYSEECKRDRVADA